MNEKKDGGPAYPTVQGGHGMSLRDWFAGMAMQGILSSEDREWKIESYAAASRHAYDIADAMLKERENG